MQKEWLQSQEWGFGLRFPIGRSFPEETFGSHATHPNSGSKDNCILCQIRVHHLLLPKMILGKNIQQM
jgi:hypothetical protein